MKSKLLISTLLLLAFAVILCSQVFANNMMQSAGNAIKSAGNTLGNATTYTGNTIVNGTRNLSNDVMNGAENITNDTDTLYSTNNDNYTAQRTAANGTGLFGMNNTMSTWLILGIVGAIIVGLIWYYGAQYEHRNYNND